MYSVSDPAANDALAACLLFGGIILMIAAAVFGLMASRVVSPKKIDKDYVYLKGAHTEFLDRFPSVASPP
jgi:hypothetical protein